MKPIAAQITAALLAAGCTVGAFKSGQDHPAGRRELVSVRPGHIIPRVDSPACHEARATKATKVYATFSREPYKWSTVTYTRGGGDTQAVPEAAGWALLAGGLAGIGFMGRRRGRA